MPIPALFAVDFGLPNGVVYASLAETILLALEERFVSYSLGEMVNIHKMEEIADIGARHGFQVWLPEASML